MATATQARALRVMAAAALSLVACGGGGHPASHAGGEEAVESHGDHGEDTVSFGQPTEERAAERTVEVTALDSLEFQPGEIDVDAGETITFVVTNEGDDEHEFVIGDEAYQDQHEQDMAHDMDMDSEPNGVELAPGQTKKITWTFAEEGTVLYACHEPGHYDGGMVGSFSLSS